MQNFFPLVKNEAEFNKNDIERIKLIVDIHWKNLGNNEYLGVFWYKDYQYFEL